MQQVTKFTVFCLSLLLLVSCGSGSGSGSGGSTSTNTSTVITPAGGTATSKDGKLTLEIPAGALTSENTITIKKLAAGEVPAEFDNFVGTDDVTYEFGPDGLTFEMPVTVRIELDKDPRQDNGYIGGSFIYAISNGEGNIVALDAMATNFDAVAGTTIVSAKMSHFSGSKFSDLAVKASGFINGIKADVFLSNVPSTSVKGVEFTAGIGLNYPRQGFELRETSYTDKSILPIEILGPRTGAIQNLKYKCQGIAAGKVVLDLIYDFKETDIETPFFIELFGQHKPQAIQISAAVNCIGGGPGGGGIPDNIVTIPPNSMGDGNNSAPDINGDGHLVGMTADASNLVPDDTNGQPDVYIYNFNTRELTKVTVAAGGTSPPSSGVSGSSEVRVSSDGRYYVLSSTDASAAKPAPGTAAKVGADTNNVSDIFLYDKQADDTTRVSVPNLADQGTLGTEADKSSLEPALSSDGRYVVFWSNARNLVTGDSNRYADIFLHDRQTGTTKRVSVPNLADQGTLGTEAAGVSFNAGNSFSPSVSDDGRYVAFRSQATNLVLNDSSGDSTNAYLKGTDIFVHDIQTGETTRVSVPNLADQGTLGTEANNNSGNPEISADGKFIVFKSDATNLVVGDTNNSCDLNFDTVFDENCTDIFLYEIGTGVLTRLSVDSNGVESNGACFSPSINSDGLYVAFECNASNLVAGDTNGKYDIFVHKTSTGATTRVSVASDGTQGDGDSGSASISGNGQYVAFDSDATTLVAGDNNGFKDVFRTPNPLYVSP